MSAEHLEFRLLKYIVAVADTGSFTAAAAKLHLSQSSQHAESASSKTCLGFRFLIGNTGTRR